MDKTKITVSERVAADTQKVCDYWTFPKHITNLNFVAQD